MLHFRVSGDSDRLVGAVWRGQPLLCLPCYVSAFMYGSNGYYINRERTPMENISRTVRHSMHSVRSSVISIPTAAPSPPTVSRPVSFGSFLHGGDSQRTVRNRNPPSNAYDDPTPHSSIVASHTVPARGDDAILWTRWDTTLPDRRFLLVGYRSGIQIWDCSDLGRLNEILSTSSTKALGDGTIVHAAFIPHLRSADDPLQASRPLLGLVLQDSSHCSFVLYSLRTHRVVKKHRFTGTAIDFAASESCIVLVRSFTECTSETITD